MITPYKDAALRYLTHGWRGPLPVGTKPQQKASPPSGYTGNEGRWPTEDEIADWVRQRPDLNIALRLPEHVVGLDVDDYDDKPGAKTMLAVTEAHGKLPRTWITTSRQGTRSGIRWFRLPEPRVLPGKLVHPDDPDISGVEVIQRTHRYAVVPPSVHPEGRPYRWIDIERKDVNGTIPRPSDFPMLPQAWIDHISRDCSCWAAFDWNRYTSTPSRDPVAEAHDKWANKMTSAYGRHDAALGGVMALVAFQQRGWPGADQHLDQLRSEFLESLGDSRDQKEAEAEWKRMIEGAEKKAATTTIPHYQERRDPSAPPDPETFDARVEEELDKLRVRDTARRRFAIEQRPPTPLPEILTLKERLARPRTETKWRIEGWQPAGTRVLLAAQYKAGKTTLTGNLGRSLVDDQLFLDSATVDPIVTGHLTILDIEMSENQLDDWLGDQGIENDHRVVVIPLRGKAATFNILDDDTRSEWAQRLKGTQYLILDCLRPILDALGLDEHREAGRFLTAFDALCDEAGIKDALVVHHMGHTGERSRGDSRLRDWPDVEWRLVRETEEPDSDRYLSAYGRDVEQSEAQLDHDPASRHLRLVGGSRANAAARAAIPDIIDFIRERGPLPKTKVEQGVDHPNHAVREGIKLAVLNGQIRQEEGSRNAHILSLPGPQLVSSSQLVTARHDEVTPTSSARYIADEVRDVCSVCDKPGDLVEVKGDQIHPQCAPADWKPEPTPEDIAP